MAAGFYDLTLLSDGMQETNNRLLCSFDAPFIYNKNCNLLLFSQGQKDYLSSCEAVD